MDGLQGNRPQRGASISRVLSRLTNTANRRKISLGDGSRILFQNKSAVLEIFDKGPYTAPS